MVILLMCIGKLFFFKYFNRGYLSGIKRGEE